jgi:hypothetical protein
MLGEKAKIWAAVSVERRGCGAEDACNFMIAHLFLLISATAPLCVFAQCFRS